jgi:PAS domain S-box-containing protein
MLRWLGQLSIHVRLIVLVVVALLPALGIAVWHLQQQKDLARESAREQARLLAGQTVGALDETLRAAEAMLSTLARRPPVRAADPAQCADRLADHATLHPAFTALTLRRVDATAVCASPAAPEPAEQIAAAPWFAAALGAPGMTVSDAFPAPSTGRWTVALTYPVRDPAGASAGLLILALDLATLNEHMLAHAPGGDIVAVTDRQQRVLLRQPGHAERVGKQIPQRFVERLSREREGAFEDIGVDGVARLYAFQTMPRTGWQVAAGLAQSAALAGHQRARTQTAVFMLLALAGALAAALLIARSIDAPVQRLSQAAQHVAAGDAGARAQPGGPRELAAVAHQFNRMLDVQAENEGRFRALTALSSDWYWEQDHDFRFVSIAPRVGEIVEFTANDHIGKTRWDLGPIGLSDEEIRRHRAQLERHEPFRDLVLRRRGPDGSPRIVAISGEPVFDAAGNFTGYRGIGRDITAQRLAEDALRAREAQYRELIDHLSAGVVVHAPDTSILLANRAASQLLGLSLDQLQGKIAIDPSWRFVREDGSPMPVDEYPVMRVKASGRPVVDLVGAIEHHAGAERVWVLSQAYPELDADGALTRIVVTFADITALKKAEQLRAERDAAALASRSKSEFLSRVSHELRTPLNAILGFGQLLQLDPAVSASPPTRERVEHVLAAGRHLLAVINDILDLTRAETGSLALAREVVEVGPLARECMTLVQPEADRRGVRLELVTRTADCRASGDPKRLRQVLMNLLSNAIKYNRAGGRVTVRLHCDAQSIHAAVEDTGQGLTPAQEAALFQPFNRLGAERSGAEGTGLGLVIARLLMQAMGGDIAVTSAPGAGSSFSLSLPRHGAGLAAQVGAVTPAPATGATGEVPAAPGARRFNVLYVEDNAANLQLMRHVFSLLPQAVLATASDAALGLAAALRERPDLVLIDLGLPGIDGYELLRRLRAEPALAGVRCAAVTANAMPADAERVRSAGFDDYIVKPFEVEALLARLRAWAETAHRVTRPA